MVIATSLIPLCRAAAAVAPYRCRRGLRRCQLMPRLSPTVRESPRRIDTNRHAEIPYLSAPHANLKPGRRAVVRAELAARPPDPLWLAREDGARYLTVGENQNRPYLKRILSRRRHRSRR